MRRDKKEILLLDTGDLLHSRSVQPGPTEKKNAGIKADLYMKAYNLMGYDAFLPGEMDLSYGVENLLQMSREARFPFVMANLIEAASGKPVFQPYIVKEVNGVRIGIMGLVSDRLPLGIPQNEKNRFRLADPYRTGKQVIAAMKKKEKCRVILAMAHMEMEEQEKLSREVLGIDFILSGHFNYYLDPEQAGKSRIFFAGARGENLGQVDITLEENRLGSRFQRMPLTTKYADDRQTTALLDEYKEKMKKIAESPVSGEPHTIPAKPESAAPRPPLYVGEKACAACHPRQHAAWKKTAHARAYRTLLQKNKTSDPICASCHTTGYGAPKVSQAQLRNVQCEACHGPGEGHPDQKKKLGKISEDLCLQCHNTANSPNFKYSEYREKIRHWYNTFTPEGAENASPLAPYASRYFDAF